MLLFSILLIDIDTYFYMQTSHAMAAALNVVQTSHSFGDLMLLVKAAESKSKQVFIFADSYAFLQYLLFDKQAMNLRPP